MKLDILLYIPLEEKKNLQKLEYYSSLFIISLISNEKKSVQKNRKTVGYHLPQIVVPWINPRIVSPFGDNQTTKVDTGHHLGILI